MASLLVEAPRSPVGRTGLERAEGFRSCVSPAGPEFSVLNFRFILGLLLGERMGPLKYTQGIPCYVCRVLYDSAHSS